MRWTKLMAMWTAAGSMTLGVAGTAGAHDLFPIVPGLTWNYVANSHNRETRFTAQETVRGRPTHKLVSWIDRVGTDDELHNFWSEDGGGRILLHGFWRPLQEFGVAYEPPIVWIEANVSTNSQIGQSWATTVTVHDFVTGDPDVSITLTLQVAAIEDVLVGTGDLLSVRIDEEVPVKRVTSAGEYDILGRRLAKRAGQGGSAARWYATSVGETQSQTLPSGDLEQLLSTPVGVGAPTWGAMKSRFRRH